MDAMKIVRSKPASLAQDNHVLYILVICHAEKCFLSWTDGGFDWPKTQMDWIISLQLPPLPYIIQSWVDLVSRKIDKPQLS